MKKISAVILFLAVLMVLYNKKEDIFDRQKESIVIRVMEPIALENLEDDQVYGAGIYIEMLQAGLLEQETLVYGEIEDIADSDSDSEIEEEFALELVADLVRPTTVQIQDGNHFGSGSIFNMDEDSILVISNQHVIQEGNTATIIFFEGTTVLGTVVHESEESDIAFIEIPVSEIEADVLVTLRYISISEEAYEQLEQNDTMFLMGYTSETGEMIKSGRIGNNWWYLEDFQQYVIYNYCEAVEGMSGSGTFDQSGNYIGMLIGGAGIESASIPVTTILEEYNKLPD
ncbi:MAG: serine protease [Eubacteriales bacterium]